MKKILFFFFILFLFASRIPSLSAALTPPQEAFYQEERIARLSDIFRQRMELWNELFIPEEPVKMEYLKKQLSAIVADPLLESDLHTFQEILAAPGSYEKIKDVKILQSDALSRDQKTETWEVTICWELEGYEGISIEKERYFVELIKINHDWLLKDYYLLP